MDETESPTDTPKIGRSAESARLNQRRWVNSSKVAREHLGVKCSMFCGAGKNMPSENEANEGRRSLHPPSRLQKLACPARVTVLTNYVQLTTGRHCPSDERLGNADLKRSRAKVNARSRPPAQLQTYTRTVPRFFNPPCRPHEAPTKLECKRRQIKRTRSSKRVPPIRSPRYNSTRKTTVRTPALERLL